MLARAGSSDGDSNTCLSSISHASRYCRIPGQPAAKPDILIAASDRPMLLTGSCDCNGILQLSAFRAAHADPTISPFPSALPWNVRNDSRNDGALTPAL